MTRDAIEAYAAKYRSLGLNPLPSKPIGKRIHPPFTGYAVQREAGMPPDEFSQLAERWNCTAIQVATGAKWGLLGIDLDGPNAVEYWESLVKKRGCPETWKVRHDPKGGMHLWFRHPAMTIGPKLVVWKQSHEKHSMIEVMGRGAILVAPPSRSPKSGNCYTFVAGGPDTEAPMADAPEWLLAMVRLEQVRLESKIRSNAPVHREHKPIPEGSNSVDRSAVVNAMADPLSLAERVGIRLVSRRCNQSGWYSCRSIFREDNNPSARLLVTKRGDLVYWECGLQKAMSIFDVAVALGLFPNIPAAINGIGRLTGASNNV